MHVICQERVGRHRRDTKGDKHPDNDETGPDIRRGLWDAKDEDRGEEESTEKCNPSANDIEKVSSDNVSNHGPREAQQDECARNLAQSILIDVEEVWVSQQEYRLSVHIGHYGHDNARHKRNRQ